MSLDNIQTPSDLIESARKYMGVPFLHQGRSDQGLDCLGLVVVAARDIGIEVVDNLHYSKSPDFDEMYEGLRRHMSPVTAREAQPGDIIWVRWNRRAYPAHLAIITKIAADGWPTVLHCWGIKQFDRGVEHRMPKDCQGQIFKYLRWHEWHGSQAA